MKLFSLKTIALFFSSIFIYSCSSEQNVNLVIDENFNSNRFRWPEENTRYHKIELANGKYNIEAKDSTRRTSVSRLNKTYLNQLKQNFTLTFKLDLLNRDLDFHSRAGIILTCSSMEYKIFITNESKILVTEELFSEKEEFILLSESPEEGITSSVQEITMVINGYNGRLLYKNNVIGEFKLKSKAISNIRIFTSALTNVDFYHLKIENN
jgi:hypothetical protein